MIIAETAWSLRTRSLALLRLDLFSDAGMLRAERKDLHDQSARLFARTGVFPTARFLVLSNFKCSFYHFLSLAFRT